MVLILKKDGIKGLLSVYAAAVLWSTIGVAARYAYTHGASAIEVTALRAGFVMVISLPYLGVKRRLETLASKEVLTASTLIVAPFYLSYLIAVDLIGVGLAAILLYTAPIWVYAYNILIQHERPSTMGFTAIILAVFGVILLNRDASLVVNNLGLIAGLSSGLLYATLIVYMEKLMSRNRELNELELALSVQGLASLPILMLLLTFGKPVILLNPIVLGAGVYLALMTGVLAYYLFYWGLRRIGSLYSSVAATLEPAMAIVWGVVLFSEKLGFEKIVGGGLILFSQIILRLGYSFRQAFS